MKNPAINFYPSDFLSGVAELTMEERGQYITLLCLQQQKNELTRKIIDLNVPNVSKDVLAKFEIDENGAYFNVRMREEIAKRQQHSKAQSERAKKRWTKKEDAQAYATAHTKADAPADAAGIPVGIGIGIGKGIGKGKEKEGFGEEKQNEVVLWPSFSDWWNLYDKKVGRKKAEPKFSKLSQRTKEAIMQHTEAYLEAQPNKQFRKDPVTYLNAEAWNDEIILPEVLNSEKNPNFNHAKTEIPQNESFQEGQQRRSRTTQAEYLRERYKEIHGHYPD